VELVDLHTCRLAKRPRRCSFDTAVLFDILQRAQEPKEVLARALQGVRSGGTVLIQVPADPRLFGPTDQAAGHLRRFTRDEVSDLIRSTGGEPLWVRRFNVLGRQAWRLHHALGAGRITSVQARAFDVLVPFARRLDATAAGEGLSWLAAVRVP
jgi:hypothetical protein